MPLKKIKITFADVGTMTTEKTIYEAINFKVIAPDDTPFYISISTHTLKERQK